MASNDPFGFLVPNSYVTYDQIKKYVTKQYSEKIEATLKKESYFDYAKQVKFLAPQKTDISGPTFVIDPTWDEISAFKPWDEISAFKPPYYTFEPFKKPSSYGVPTPNVINGGKIKKELELAIPGSAAMVDCPAHSNDMMANEYAFCVKGSLRRPLFDTIIHLNDHHKWTREKIADWLETLDDSIDINFHSETGES